MGTKNIETDHGGKTALHYAAENSELSVNIIFHFIKSNQVSISDSEDFMQTSSTINDNDNSRNTTFTT